MKILVDAFGGDNAPLEIIKGCELAVNEYGVEIILTGNKDIITQVAAQNGVSLNNMEIVHCTDVITMEDHPTELMKSKKESSLAVALKMLAEDKADGFVGAGSTGAILTGATLIVKRIKGVKRPALAPVIPADNGKFMLIDCGANADCRPEMLVQFAKMGSVYMENVLGVSNPRVGLVNIGTESTKGDELRVETYAQLENSGLNFIGNAEARDIPFGVCDVAVADGFTGNVVLKMYEGTASFVAGKFKEVFKKNIKNKLAAAVILSDLNDIKKSLDYNEYGGAPFLGVKKPVFKAHGSSSAVTFKNAIGQLVEFVNADVIGKISSQLED
ncbi:MAG: phosphate acyltransferase PlsX [Clostridia bacterium]|nr:phosphate acyltransferase PlsX [Clostridia bacterium]